MKEELTNLIGRLVRFGKEVYKIGYYPEEGSVTFISLVTKTEVLKIQKEAFNLGVSEGIYELVDKDKEKDAEVSYKILKGILKESDCKYLHEGLRFYDEGGTIFFKYLDDKKVRVFLVARETGSKSIIVTPEELCESINSDIDIVDLIDHIMNARRLKKSSNKREEPKRILILNVHPDDDVLAFGGLLAKALRNGDEVYMHTFCVGGPCSNVPTKVRIAELTEVSEFFNVKRSTYDDRELDGILSTIPNSQVTKIIDELIKDIKPDEVYCSPYSEHTDHRALYEAFMGSARLKEGWMPKLFAVGCYPFSDQLYQTQVGGKIFQPLSEDDFNKKLEAFKLYKSQFKPSPSPLGVESLEHQSRYYGMLCGAPYAELYYQLRYIRSL